MAYINFQPSDFFNTVLYTGNNTAKSITGVGFQPDFIWDKNRSDVFNHYLNDSSRGVTKYVNSNNSGAEVTIAQGITSFDSDGFSVGTDNSHNANGTNLVAWNWKANGGTTSSNTDGSITSTVQAGTVLSIVTYTGNGTAGATVGHGLGAVPDCLIVKGRDIVSNWQFISKALDADKFLELNQTDGQLSQGTYNMFNSTRPTSTVFTLGNHQNTNQSGNDYVAYCFAEVKGYSKFGSYTGNGSTNGTFVYTGFRPAFVMTKRTNAVGPWNMKDTKRPGYNDTDDSLFADSTAVEDTRGFDILSNGFKLRNSGTEMNGGGSTYIYMAFAEFPLVGSNGLAGTAR